MNRSEVPIMLCSFSKFSYQGSSTNLNCSWRNHFSIRLISTQVKPFLFNEMGWGKTIIHKELNHLYTWYIHTLQQWSPGTEQEGWWARQLEPEHWGETGAWRERGGSETGLSRVPGEIELLLLECKKIQLCWRVFHLHLKYEKKTFIWHQQNIQCKLNFILKLW